MGEGGRLLFQCSSTITSLPYVAKLGSTMCTECRLTSVNLLHLQNFAHCVTDKWYPSQLLAETVVDIINFDTFSRFSGHLHPSKEQPSDCWSLCHTSVWSAAPDRPVVQRQKQCTPKRQWPRTNHSQRFLKG